MFETIAPAKRTEYRENGLAAADTARRLVTFYDRKTAEILRRYGPGPRVHYHTGLIDEPPSPYASREELRGEVIAAQERTLNYAAERWNGAAHLSGEVLDVGCGLGGGAIFWAQKFRAQVTAVTIVPSHLALVQKFAAEAGVAAQVRGIVCDASAVAGENCFDAAVAIDSSSSFPRRPWFQRLAGLLRPGGRVFIFDCFLGRAEYAESFNRHWCCQIGTIEEYIGAARQAHFAVDMIEDVSNRALHFWTRTLALLRLETRQSRLTPLQRGKLAESSHTHALVQQGLLGGGLRHVLMSFVRHQA